VEPVGSLARGRPGVLSLTMQYRPAVPGMRAAYLLVATRSGLASGPLHAVIVVLPGFTLRSGSAGAGWQCAQAAAEIVCDGPSIAAGQVGNAFVPVDLSDAASGGTSVCGSPGQMRLAPAKR
jgi:hypothetical protein